MPANACFQLYRYPIDLLETYTTVSADTLLANSEFTRGVICDTFGGALGAQGADRVHVLYPGVHLSRYDTPYDRAHVRDTVADAVESCARRGGALLLSINRFERKKRLDVAVRALAWLVANADTDAARSAQLLLAGGYDSAVAENVEHYDELAALATELGVRDRVTLVRSFSDDERAYLLAHAALLFYTPPNEHFGIVPLESMFSRVPVVACNSGGPRETVVDALTGRLCADGDAAEFGAAAAAIVALDDDQRRRMADAGRQRVLERFSLDAFTEQLVRHVHTALDGDRPKQN